MSGSAIASTRREFMTIAAGGAALVFMPASADATSQQVVDEAKKLFGDKKFIEGKVKLDLPSIAENGLVVPLGFEVESAMTDADHVKAVHLFAEGNPSPQVAAFFFTTMSPKAAASIRIRLAQSQNIVAFAEMANGEIYTSRKEVKVTIGGCGG
jgi:sulfur-oxidizing protein SoxY